MKKKVKRGAAFLLTIVLILTMIPIMEHNLKEVKAADITTGQQLLDAMPGEEGTLILQNDVEISETLVLEGTWYIDFNGHKIKDGGIESGNPVIRINNASTTVYFQDSSALKNGGIEAGTNVSCISLQSGYIYFRNQTTYSAVNQPACQQSGGTIFQDSATTISFFSSSNYAFLKTDATAKTSFKAGAKFDSDSLGAIAVVKSYGDADDFYTTGMNDTPKFIGYMGNNLYGLSDNRTTTNNNYTVTQKSVEVVEGRPINFYSGSAVMGNETVSDTKIIVDNNGERSVYIDGVKYTGTETIPLPTVTGADGNTYECIGYYQTTDFLTSTGITTAGEMPINYAYSKVFCKWKAKAGTESGLQSAIYQGNVEQIILKNDVEIEYPISGETDINLDMNGKTLTSDNETIISYGTITISDSVGGGALISLAKDSSCGPCLTSANLTIGDGVTCKTAGMVALAVGNEAIISNSVFESEAADGYGIQVAKKQGTIEDISGFLAEGKVLNNDTSTTDENYTYSAKKLIVSDGPRTYGVTADSIELGTMQEGATSLPQKSISISNSGNANIKIIGIALDDTLKDGCDVSTSVTNKTLLPGEQDTSTLIKAKSDVKAGTYSGNAVISYQKLDGTTEKKNVSVTLTVQEKTAEKDDTKDNTDDNSEDDSEVDSEVDTKTETVTPFTITYIDTPKNPYQLSGTQGTNGWYTSEVTIMPPLGYTISQTQTGEYAAELVISQTSSPIIFLQSASGGITQAVPVGTIKIDREAPGITGCVNGSTYYTDSKQITVTDENLTEITINGEPAEVTPNSATTVINLAADNENAYEITATDEAGHTTTCQLTVQDTWMRDGITGSGKKKLKAGVAYKLGNGKWTIARDTTVYEGGGTFYATESGEFDFQQK